MQQILALVAPISSAAAREKYGTLTGKQTIRVDRMQVFLRAVAKSDGTLPTPDQLKMVESCLSIKCWTDLTKQVAIAVQPVPVNAIQSREIGPVPVQPFSLNGNQQFTIEWSENSTNLFSAAAFTASSALELVVVLWGTDERKG